MTIARSRVWRAWVPLNLALVAFALFFVGLRLVRPGTVFYYTEGPVLGSLAALEERGDLTALYPADGWVEPPVVLTLYPPLYFLAAAAADRWTGGEGTFLGLRIVSAAAFLGVLGLLLRMTRRRKAPVAWILALTGAALLTPSVYRVAAGAQADSLALLFTWVGIAAVLNAGEEGVRANPRSLLLASAAFLLAFFCKQSFVAAPAALTMVLVLERRVREAALFSAGLAAAAVLGMAALNGVTSGGYLANTLGALAGSSGWANLGSTLFESEPVQWLPIVAVVLFAVKGRLRPGFPEMYLIGSSILHTAAMLKTGSSVNYLLEPTFALLLLAAVRCAAPNGDPGPEPRGAQRNRKLAGALAWTFPLALGLTASVAAIREYPLLKAWVASAGAAQVSEFEGHPLVDALFFPAVLQRGERPWLNDPFAFGALEETGRWDPSRLVEDLASHDIPFALTTVDISGGAAPEGVGTRELVMAYFWRSPRIWTALTGAYQPTASGPVTVWLPISEEP